MLGFEGIYYTSGQSILRMKQRINKGKQNNLNCSIEIPLLALLFKLFVEFARKLVFIVAELIAEMWWNIFSHVSVC